MNYHQCISCGIKISYPTNLVCRNDVINSLRTKGWNVHDDTGTDVWYCPDCQEHIPADQVHIPATVEYRGFTITFAKIFGEGNPYVRCQIREIPDHFEIYKIKTLTQDNIQSMIDGAMGKVDLLYLVLEKGLGQFKEMVDKQAHRHKIDQRVADSLSVSNTQFEILRDFFLK